jgi:hypothetical protein
VTRERECLIHIGTHKTGTSLFQEILFNDPAMQPGGAAVYPRCGIWPYDRSHNLFGTYFWDDIRLDLQKVPFEQMVEQILAEAADAERVVISSETLEKCPLRGNGRIAEFVALLKSRGYRVTILYVIRRPDQLVDSVFKQWVRDFDTRFCSAPLGIARDEAYDMNFARVAGAWQNLPGVEQVTVIPYIDADPLRTVSTLLEICGVAQDVSVWRGVVANPSLDGFALRFKHFVNRYPFDRDFNERLLEVIDQLIAQQGVGPRLTMFSPEQRGAYLHLFEGDWARLEKHYDVDLSPWCVVNASPSDIFETLRRRELPRGLRWLRTVDPAIAQALEQIVSAGARHLDKVQSIA